MQFAHISLFTAGSSVGDYRIQPSKAMVSEVNLKQRLRQLDLPVPPLPRPAPTVRPACAAGLADLASAMAGGPASSRAPAYIRQSTAPAPPPQPPLKQKSSPPSWSGPMMCSGASIGTSTPAPGASQLNPLMFRRAWSESSVVWRHVIVMKMSFQAGLSMLSVDNNSGWRPGT